MTLTNSTVSGNQPEYVGGGIYNTGTSNGNASLTLTNGTVSSNSAGGGGGIIFNDGRNSGSAPVTIGNTILNAGVSEPNIVNEGGAVTSNGYNLSSDGGVTNFNGGTGSLAATGDQTNTNPKLDPWRITVARP